MLMHVIDAVQSETVEIVPLPLEVTAFRSPAFPCNPRPFARALSDLLANGYAIDSDECKAVLWILNAQSYGQMARIDLCDEYGRLDEVLA